MSENISDPDPDTDLDSAYRPVTPLSVVAEEATGWLSIEWSDGRTTEYPIEWLRWQCPCALCRGEMGVPGRLSRVSQLSPEETTLVDAQPVGRYGIMFFWADGHHDGIYTYDWLRANSQDRLPQAHGGGEVAEGQRPQHTGGPQSQSQSQSQP